MPPRLGWECRPCPVFASNYALAFTLQLRKITVKPQSGQPKIAWQITAEHDSFGRLGQRLAVASTPLLAPVAVGLHFERRGQPSARVNICRVAELRGSPRQLTLCRNSQLFPDHLTLRYCSRNTYLLRWRSDLKAAPGSTRFKGNWTPGNNEPLAVSIYVCGFLSCCG